MTDHCTVCGSTELEGKDGEVALYKGMQLCTGCAEKVKNNHAGMFPIIYMHLPNADSFSKLDIVDRLSRDFSVDTAYAAIGEIQRLREMGRKGAARLIEEIGASGPEHFEDTVERAAERLNVYRRALIAIRDMLHLPKTETRPLIEEVLRKETKLLEEWENLQLQRDQGM